MCPDPQATNPTPCLPGSYQANRGQSSCHPCDRRYTSGSGATSCQLCSNLKCPLVVNNTCGVGCGLNKYYSDGTCKVCDPGTLNVDNPCATTQQECFSGGRIDYYVNISDGHVRPCEPGTIAKWDWSSCEPCVSGTYADGSPVYAPPVYAEGSPANGIPCKAGTFANQSGLSACYACEPGSFSNVVGRGDACDKCPAGQECPFWGMTTGTNCTPGSFSSTSGGAVQCSACPNGTVSSVHGSVSCVKCDSSQHMVSPTMAGTTCVYCFGTSIDNTQCRFCGLGAYFDTSTQSCLMCAAG